MRILEEARQPKTRVAGVLRRLQVDATTFYLWERQAKAGIREALSGQPHRYGQASDGRVVSVA